MAFCATLWVERGDGEGGDGEERREEVRYGEAGVKLKGKEGCGGMGGTGQLWKV